MYFFYIRKIASKIVKNFIIIAWWMVKEEDKSHEYVPIEFYHRIHW